VRELLNLALFLPDLVIAVLGAAPAVDTGNLDVAKRVGRNPDASPSRRDTESTNALERFGISNLCTGGIAIVSSFVPNFAYDPRSVGITSSEAWNSGAKEEHCHTSLPSIRCY
jgi:hypothetical protein